MRTLQPLLTLLVLLARAPVAEARPTATNLSDEEQALRLLDRGIEMYERGDYEDALKVFDAVLILADKPNPRRWLARAQARLGLCDAAVGHFETFLRRVPEGHPKAAEVKEERDRCLDKLREKEKNAPSTVGESRSGALAPRRSVDLRVAPSPARVPVYRRGWFWTGFLVVLVGGAVATTVGLAVTGVLSGPVEPTFESILVMR